MPNLENQIKAVMLGHAVADALGVPVEFCGREELTLHPVTQMEGFGTYDVPAGSWSDDTSMSLAALDVLADGKLDLTMIMENFGAWYHHGKYTPTGVVFDVGGTCSMAINHYFVHHMAPVACGSKDERSNGNGSLMRIHPFVLMAYADPYIRTNLDEVIDEASSLTHAHERSKLGCRIYAQILLELLETPEKDAIRRGLHRAAGKYFDTPEYAHYERLFEEDFAGLPVEQIKSSGYVVDTLEAAVWCLLTTDTYEACVLKAVNLGEDTDTVGAVAGGLAGALYGYDAIPTTWLNTLLLKHEIEEMCHRAAVTWGERVASVKPCPYPVADVHMHILPGMDDGARHIDESLDMLKMSISQGVTDVFCSTHNGYAQEFKEKYEEMFERLSRAVQDEGLAVRLHKGCEVLCEETYMDDIIDALDRGIYPTLANTRYVLTEFYPSVKPSEALTIISRLQAHGYKPIIAHMERNPYITVAGRMVELMVAKGALIQVNAYSFWSESNPKIRQRARELLQNKLIHVIGSDAHRLAHRPPRIDTGLRYILEHTDATYAQEILFGNAQKIWLGEEI